MIVVREDCFSQYINCQGYVVRPLGLNYEGKMLLWRDSPFAVGDKITARCNSHFNPVFTLKGGNRWYGVMNWKLHQLILDSPRPLDLFQEHFAFVSVRVGKLYTIGDYERELIRKLPRQNKIDKLLSH